MSQPHSRARQQAELAFAKAQSQFRDKEGRAVDELAAAAEAGREKTLRLRTARLARELDVRAHVASAIPQEDDQGEAPVQPTTQTG